MIEICFSPSVEGNIKASHKFSSDDVCCMEFMLDVGLLNVPVDSFYRRNLFNFMFSQAYFLDDTGMDIYFDKSSLNLKRLLEKISLGEGARIWVGTTAQESCSLRWVCWMLRSYGVDEQISVVEPPGYLETALCVPGVNSWAFADPKDLDGFEELERQLDFHSFNSLADQWSQLCAENTMMRSVIDEELISVNENVFDSEIANLVPPNPIKESKIVAECLCGPLRFHNDLVCAWRINELIKIGALKAGEPNDSFSLMSRTIQR